MEPQEGPRSKNYSLCFRQIQVAPWARGLTPLRVALAIILFLLWQILTAPSGSRSSSYRANDIDEGKNLPW